MSWTDPLKQTVTRLRKHKEKSPLRVAIVGIGHEMRGDDAAGLAVAQRLRPLTGKHLLVIEAGHAPENHTGLLRRFEPDLVLLVDSAQLDEQPGTIRWLSWQDTSGLSATTHTMPPYMLARYLTSELNCDVALVGVQPGSTTLGASLSPPVQQAVQLIAQALASYLDDPAGS